MSSIEPVNFLRQMLEIESFSRNEAHLAHFLSEQMNSLGFKSYVDEAGNAVGIREGIQTGDNVKELLLLGHMDTVSGRIPVKLDGEKLYGRGAVDAKGPLAAFIIAASKVHLPENTRLVVIGAVEEETPTSRGARHVATTFHPNACVIGEPSGTTAITLGYKGRLLVDYFYEQPSGHSAGPGVGVGEVAISWWNALQAFVNKFNLNKEKIFDQLMINLRSIHTSSNGLYDGVRATVGLRLPPGLDPNALEISLRELTADAEVNFYGHEVAVQSDKNQPLARAFVRAIRRSNGEPKFKLKTGTSDMNVVTPVWKVPIVAYGPGDSRLDHTPDEHILVNDLLTSINVLENAISDCLSA
ncbi:MAG: [LysW]-lysine hydrolase [Blastocatellia bacterium]|nr:[LysW]-lysine hydrolase [Blastocatellia bacterium]